MAGAFEDPNQKVPPGNPFEEYLRQRALQEQAAGVVGGAGGGMIAGAGLLEMLEGNPLGLPAALGGAWLGGDMLSSNMREARQLGDGANMWGNQFGNGDPNQGLPGLPSGPAYRRR